MANLKCYQSLFFSCYQSAQPKPRNFIYLFFIIVCLIHVLHTPKGSVFESNVIAFYIARSMEGTSNPLLGSSLYELGLIKQWIIFSSSKVKANICRWLYPRLVAIMNLKRALTTLDSYLSSNTYLVRDCVTLADIIMTCDLFRGFNFLLTKSFTEKFPNVERYFWIVVKLPEFSSELGRVIQTVIVPEVQSARSLKRKVQVHDEAPKPKAKNPLDMLPPITMILDEYDPEGYSLWLCHNKYSEDNLVSLKSKVDGFLQRIELVHDYNFGKMLIIGKEPNVKVTGLWLFRRKEIPQFFMDGSYGMESYDWVKVDIFDDCQKERVNQIFKGQNPFEGEALLEAKIF
ncbi:hypothetical protein MKW94_001587 [Papaver nudicaule]|uniref:Elongation factor 1-gamma n=1 Tax=Papaver nudicaule TaxID=74823 RepID=A0AA41S6Q4_PAPNU|nr:hypothetical protein [Papaver nudicaule]